MLGNRRIIITIATVFLFCGFTFAESVIVAPSDATAETKAKADLICTGSGDQNTLLLSINMASTEDVDVIMLNGQMSTFSCKVRHSVLWLPGTYNLSAPLIIPDSADCVINAEGTFISSEASVQTTVVIRGMYRCDYRFGVIFSNNTTISDSAALRIDPGSMPVVASYIGYTGLQGLDGNTNGYALNLVADSADIFSNNIAGTNIEDFYKAIVVEATAPYFCSSNEFWMSYCIYIKYGGVDILGNTAQKNFWQVNLDVTNTPGGPFGHHMIQTAGCYDRWSSIIAPADYVVIFDPGAKSNIIELHPDYSDFAFIQPVVNNSGNDTNIMLGAKQPPYN